jgi:hypothetical protein
MHTAELSYQRASARPPTLQGEAHPYAEFLEA